MAQPRPLPPLSEKDAARFWSRVDVKSVDECWPWKQSCFRGGYGQWKLRGRNLKAHRIAYALTFGDDPTRLVLHSCDNPPCCNPAHHFLGDEAANSADCKNKGRLNTAAGERHGSKTKPERVSQGTRHPHARLTEEDVRTIHREYREGQTTHRELAERFGLKRESVSEILRGNNWKHIAAEFGGRAPCLRSRSGAKNAATKLTEAEASSIIRRFAAGESRKALAREFGVSTVTVAHIGHGLGWKHLPR